MLSDTSLYGTNRLRSSGVIYKITYRITYDIKLFGVVIFVLEKPWIYHNVYLRGLPADHADDNSENAQYSSTVEVYFLYG